VHSFEYFAPKSIKEAISLLQEHGEEAKILAGGLSLIPLMRLGLAQPKCIIDLKKIRELSYIRSEDAERVSVGALTKHVDIANSKLLFEKCRILNEAASLIGHPQIRNKGTIGGSISHADQAADYPPVAVALDAQMKIVGPDREKVVEAKQFFRGTFETAIESREILTEISIPTLGRLTGSAYMKLCLSPGDFPILGFAAIVSLNEAGVCDGIRLAIGGVSDVPIRLEGVEKILLEKRITDEMIKDAGEITSQSFQAADDIRASAKYKTRMAKVYAERTIRKALQRIPNISGSASA
jgi:carbon-monoxide dehydrogenase medium subunit